MAEQVDGDRLTISLHTRAKAEILGKQATTVRGDLKTGPVGGVVIQMRWAPVESTAAAATAPRLAR